MRGYFNVRNYKGRLISLCRYRDLNTIEEPEMGPDDPIPLDEAAELMSRGYILEQTNG